MAEIMGVFRHRLDVDGVGVSTLVAFHGCPLRCKYCINDFCHDEKTRTKNIEPTRLVELLAKDDIYYRMTGGGVVFGGGEPLINSDYILSVVKQIPLEWAVRIETSLNVEWECIEQLIPFVDQWIIDIKDLNPEIYTVYTGKDNEVVLRNIDMLRLYVEPKQLLFRIPHIPEFNTKKDMEISKKYLENWGEIELFEYDTKV